MRKKAKVERFNRKSKKGDHKRRLKEEIFNRTLAFWKG